MNQVSAWMSDGAAIPPALLSGRTRFNKNAFSRATESVAKALRLSSFWNLFRENIGPKTIFLNLNLRKTYTTWFFGVPPILG